MTTIMTMTTTMTDRLGPPTAAPPTHRYDLLYTPHVANLDLWKTSGHFDFYKEGMFDQMEVEGDMYQIKPMNCPFHCLVYKDDLRSYR